MSVWVKVQCSTMNTVMRTICHVMFPVSFLQEYSGAPFTGSDPTNDIRVVGFGLVTLLLLIALIGLDWEAKVLLY